MLGKAISTLVGRRPELMGVSILMVLLFHMYCWPFANPRLSLFRYGYIGVDIFLLLSGFGLCYAIKKYDLRTFYRRRLLRLFPIYWLMCIITYLFEFWEQGLVPSLWSVICKLLTLSYWGIGGSFDDNWFIGSILLLYLLFPIIYRFVNKYGALVIAISCILSSVVLSCINIHWRYDCLVSRIPIFVFGILCALYSQEKTTKKEIKKAFIYLFVCWIVSISMQISMFLDTACICPIVLLLLTFGVNKICAETKNVQMLLCFLGTNSYLLYVSNTLTAWSMQWATRHYAFYTNHVIYVVFFYLSFTMVYGCSFLLLKNLVNKSI